MEMKTEDQINKHENNNNKDTTNQKPFNVTNISK
jgi:hypothetical protein